MNMGYKFVFLDIDGTICYPGEEPSKNTVAAIVMARQNGHRIFIATGRNEITIPANVLKIGFDGAICSAGARIRVGDQVLYDCKLNDDQIEKGIAILKSFGIHPVLEGMQYSYSEMAVHKELLLREVDTTNSETLRLAHQILHGGRYRDMALYQGEPVYKITYMSRDRQKLLDACKVLQADYDCVIYEGMNSRFGLVSGEMTAKGVDKGAAIGQICRHYQMSAVDVIAFGDSANDLSMLQAAGIGVAMGNAPDVVKQVADRVCETCQQEGIFHEFKRLGLI